MAEKRRFTGAFIPAHIWVSKELIPAEKMMLGEIDCLSKETGWCYAGRKHFAEWLHCTPQNVTHYTNRLVELGYLEIVKVVGGTSRMRLKNKVVNGTDGGGKPDFPGVESRTDGGGKPDFPKIQYKNKSEIQGQRQTAKNEFSPDTADDAPEYEVQIFEPMRVETVRLEAQKQKTSNGARRDLGDDFAEMLEKEYGVKVVTVPSSEPIPDTLGKAKKPTKMEFRPSVAAFARFELESELAALETDYTVAENFSLSRKIPAEKFGEYVAAFKFEARTRNDYNRRADLRGHFFNWAAKRHAAESQATKPKPNGAPNPISRPSAEIIPANKFAPGFKILKAHD